MANKKYILILIYILFILILFLVSTQNNPFLRLDTWITKIIYKILSQNKLIVELNLFITNYTLGSVYAAILLALILLIKKKFKYFTIFIFLGILLFITEYCLKDSLQRIRPFFTMTGISNLANETISINDYSFPSGHSMFAFYLATFLYLRFKAKNKSRLAVLALFLALLVALSRVALGVHFLSDTIAGSLIGIMFGYQSKLVEKIKIRIIPVTSKIN